MLTAIPRAAIRARRPTSNPRPPRNSAQMAKNARGGGICIMPVKNPIVAEKPLPPNQPSAFWLPCAKKINPKTTRTIAVAGSFSVEVNLLNTLSPSPCFAQGAPASAIGEDPSSPNLQDPPEVMGTAAVNLKQSNPSRRTSCSDRMMGSIRFRLPVEPRKRGSRQEPVRVIPRKRRLEQGEETFPESQRSKYPNRSVWPRVCLGSGTTASSVLTR